MCIGMIDIGSNTVRLAVYEVKGKKYKKIFSKKKTLGLISYVENRKLSKEGIDKLTSIIKEFDGILTLLCISQRHYFATASLREIKNESEVTGRLQESTGTTIKVISGEEEGYLDYLAVSKNNNIKEGIIVDIGGGSTELIEVKDEEAVSFCSFPIGSLNLFQRYVEFILPKEKEMNAVSEEIKEYTGEIDYSGQKTVIGVGGTCRAAASICSSLFYQGEKVKKVTLKDLKRMVSMAAEDPQRLSHEILKKKPDRIHTLIPGMLILIQILKKAGALSMEVDNAGVKEGYLLKHVLGAADEKI
ncbi:Ppx/GppA phosphatase family protein [Anaerostipes sp.]|uniref:Ppx/GppA phosphatase family protein n=1 Tax=Anaerostipes sp. TaxID=1872530 RepID=UPI0025BCAC67|nr:hypothetical protein [Anaerostipes sp.]MBS7008458.1 hypothetical protein [Anaerostipes sp.]